MQDNGSTIAVNSVEESEQLQSAIAGYIVYGFEILLVILVGIAIYLFSSKRQKSVESPKYRMMEDDDDNDESK